MCLIMFKMELVPLPKFMTQMQMTQTASYLENKVFLHEKLLNYRSFILSRVVIKVRREIGTELCFISDKFSEKGRDDN